VKSNPAGNTYAEKYKFSGNKLVELSEGEGLDWPYAQRAPVVGGNWKSNGDLGFISTFPKTGINTAQFDNEKMSVCVAPTDIHLTELEQTVTRKINVMAQNVSQYPGGAFTGNITAGQLKDIGVNWAITGHSERRARSGTTDQDVAMKTKVAIENGLMVMACIGECLEERELDKTDMVNARQLQAIADELEEDQWTNVVIAYEPIWAIGTGMVATAQQAEDTHFAIRKWLATNVSPEVAAATRILYGGSVNAKNCEKLIQ